MARGRGLWDGASERSEELWHRLREVPGLRLRLRCRTNADDQASDPRFEIVLQWGYEVFEAVLNCLGDCAIWLDPFFVFNKSFFIVFKYLWL